MSSVKWHKLPRNFFFKQVQISSTSVSILILYRLWPTLKLNWYTSWHSKHWVAKGKEIYLNLSFITLGRLCASSSDILDSLTDFFWKNHWLWFLDTWGFFHCFFVKKYACSTGKHDSLVKELFLRFSTNTVLLKMESEGTGSLRVFVNWLCFLLLMLLCALPLPSVFFIFLWLEDKTELVIETVSFICVL